MMGRQAAVVLYVLALVAVVVGVDATGIASHASWGKSRTPLD
jgi:hypothetical protein